MKMTEKQPIESLIVRYLEEEITEDDLRVLETWLARSPDNRNLFFQLKSLYDMRHRPTHATDADKEAVWQRMLHRMEREEPQGASSPTVKLWKPARRRVPGAGYGASRRGALFLKYAALAILLFSLGWGASRYEWRQAETPRAGAVAPSFNEIRVEKGSRANTLILSDGSKVILNAGTTFRYPEGFNRACAREVYLDGEAYFEVARDTLRPFRVKLQGQTITVLGTRFNVEAYSGQPYSVTTLLSGSIALETFDDTGKARSCTLLKPNERACSDNHTGVITLESADPTLARAWINGEYKFKNEPLESIIHKLEKAYDVSICLDDDTLKQIRYTGTFSYRQDIREVLRIINYEKRFIFKQTGKNIFLTQRSMSNS